jgi:DNA-binding NtrC family response regulator
LDVLRLLKSERPAVEVIVATAYGELDLAVEALRYDASDFITKPISDEALSLALQRPPGPNPLDLNRRPC